MSRSAYSNDLTDAEWHVLFPFFPPEASVGRPRKWSLREILDGIFYVLRGGIAWRAMPHDLPPWQVSSRDLGRDFLRPAGRHRLASDAS
ncbi:transposase [Deinococcus sp. Leaf326]|uniref:transposase n=1 Tax=Deinococcus sp. Leaf326 TaxID=1736338 RepID=UPI003512F234